MVTKKHNVTAILIIMSVLFVSTVGAAAVEEISVGTKLWNKADAIMDASESYIPRIRRISYKETDGKGNVVYADQAVVLIEGSHNDRFLAVREFGDNKVLKLMNRFTDGLILTPFNDNLYDMDFAYTGVDETIQDKSTTVYTFSMAYDVALPYYDPNYSESGTIVGWDVDDDDFDGNVTGMLWIDKITGAPRKMETSYLFEDNTEKGTLSLTQTVYFSNKKSVALPFQISTQGSLQVKAGQQGRILITDFQILEEQDEFWENAKFAKGELVY